MKLVLSNLTVSQNKLKNIYRNTKKYPVPNKVKFRMSDSQLKITMHSEKEENTTYNEKVHW